MDWDDLLTAFALYLVLEGLLPFIHPVKFRQITARLSILPQDALRRLGIAAMFAGVMLLYFVR